MLVWKGELKKILNNDSVAELISSDGLQNRIRRFESAQSLLFKVAYVYV